MLIEPITAAAHKEEVVNIETVAATESAQLANSTTRGMANRRRVSGAVDRLVDRVPTLRQLWVSAALLSVYMIVMNLGALVVARLAGYHRSSGMLFGLSMSPGYGPRRAHDILIALGARGRLADAVTLAIFDVAFPIVYAMLLSRGLRLVAARLGWPTRARKTVAVIPLVAVAANWLADVCIVSLIVAFPHSVDSLAMAASALTGVKFVVIAASAACLVGSAGLVGLQSRARAAATVVR